MVNSINLPWFCWFWINQHFVWLVYFSVKNCWLVQIEANYSRSFSIVLSINSIFSATSSISYANGISFSKIIVSHKKVWSRCIHLSNRKANFEVIVTSIHIYGTSLVSVVREFFSAGCNISGELGFKASRRCFSKQINS